MAVYSRSSRVYCSPREVWVWHEGPDALRELVPPWEPVQVIQAPPSLAPGTKAGVQVGPFSSMQMAPPTGSEDANALTHQNSVSS